MVIPNLMIGFGIDQVQAEYVAEIRLRNINKEYILRRVQEEEALRDEIDDLEDTLNSPQRLKKLIISELEHVKKTYAAPRRTDIVFAGEDEAALEEESVPDYPVHLFLSREGYFKKITPASLRMAAEQKYKEGDGPFQAFQARSGDEAMFFTDKCQVYKVRLTEFDDTKASALGDYLPSKLSMEGDEHVVFCHLPGADYGGYLLFFFENGKAAKVAVSAYQTASNRRKLTGAYSDKSPLAAVVALREDRELAVYSTEGRALIFSTALLSPKATRSTQGVQVMALKPRYRLSAARALEDTPITNLGRYRCRSIPAAGALVKEEDGEDRQMALL